MELIHKIKNKILNSDSSKVRSFGLFLQKKCAKFINSHIGTMLLCSPHMDDKKYIMKKHMKALHYYPDLDNPKSFNEKNNWRKLHDRKDIYTSFVDKYKIKSIISERIGAEHTFPLLGVYDKPSDIDFGSLPEKFVLKVNHVSGGVFICRDKSKFDKKKVLKDIKRFLKIDYYLPSREWPYKNIERKIVCEKYMGENLIDYKNYCFNGKLAYTFVWQNVAKIDGRKPVAYYCGGYDRCWNKTSMEVEYPTMDEVVPKPDCYVEMVECCEKMSQGLPFARVDCYIINNHVYVGEVTFFPWGGFLKFKDEQWNMKLGEMEKLTDEHLGD